MEGLHDCMLCAAVCPRLHIWIFQVSRPVLCTYMMLLLTVGYYILSKSPGPKMYGNPNLLKKVSNFQGTPNFGIFSRVHGVIIQSHCIIRAMNISNDPRKITRYFQNELCNPFPVVSFVTSSTHEWPCEIVNISLESGNQLLLFGTCNNPTPDIVVLDHSMLKLWCSKSLLLNNILNVYSTFDSIRRNLFEIRTVYPQSIIAWWMPMIQSGGAGILDDLITFLTSTYLIQCDGILVVSSANFGRGSQILVELREQLTNLANFRIMYDRLFVREMEFPRILAFAKEEIEKVGILNKNDPEIKQFSDSFDAGQCSMIINSRKWDPHCFPPSTLLLPLLVTGLGGAGSHNITSLLLRWGARVVHESIDSDGAVCWMYAVNDVVGGAPYPHHARLDQSTFFSPRFHRVIHVMRNPLAQISALTAHLPDSYAHIRTHMLLKNDSWVQRHRHKILASPSAAGGRDCSRGDHCNLHFAALSWVFWNKHVESYADAIYRVDQIEELIADSTIFLRHFHQLGLGASFDPTYPWPASRRLNSSAVMAGSAAPEILSTNTGPVPLTRRPGEVPDSRAMSMRMNMRMKMRMNMRAPVQSAVGARAHKRHLEYTYADIETLDPGLAAEIRAMARKYGFKDSPKES